MTIRSKLKLYPTTKSPDGYFLDVATPDMLHTVLYQYAKAVPHGGSNGGLSGSKGDLKKLNQYINNLLLSESILNKDVIEGIIENGMAASAFCEYLAENEGQVEGFAQHYEQIINRKVERDASGAFKLPAAPSLKNLKEFVCPQNQVQSMRSSEPGL